MARRAGRRRARRSDHQHVGLALGLPGHRAGRGGRDARLPAAAGTVGGRSPPGSGAGPVGRGTGLCRAGGPAARRRASRPRGLRDGVGVGRRGPRPARRLRRGRGPGRRPAAAPPVAAFTAAGRLLPGLRRVLRRLHRPRGGGQPVRPDRVRPHAGVPGCS